MCGPKFCSMQISRHLGEEGKRVQGDDVPVTELA